jgi:hypothetical protein
VFQHAGNRGVNYNQYKYDAKIKGRWITLACGFLAASIIIGATSSS